MLHFRAPDSPEFSGHGDQLASLHRAGDSGTVTTSIFTNGSQFSETASSLNLCKPAWLLGFRDGEVETVSSFSRTVRSFSPSQSLRIGAVFPTR